MEWVFMVLLDDQAHTIPGSFLLVSGVMETFFVAAVKNHGGLHFHYLNAFLYYGAFTATDH